MDRTALGNAYKFLKIGSLWKKYAQSNPGEASKIDSYINSIVSGSNPSPPTLTTATGQGIVGLVAAGIDVVIPPPPPPPPATTGTGSGTAREGSSYQSTYNSSFSKLDGILIDVSDQYDQIAGWLPNTRVWFYRSAISVNKSYDNSIPLSQAQTLGLLKDSSGNLIVNKDYTSNYVLDFSNPNASTALGNASVTWCKNNKFAGVWFDDVVATMSLFASAPPAGWDNSYWVKNMISHVRRVSKVMRASGLEVILNANGRFFTNQGGADNGYDEAQYWAAILATETSSEAPPTGLTAEYWLQNPNDTTQVKRSNKASGATWNDNWEGWRALHAQCNNAGAAFIPMQYGDPDSAECIYGKATFLLDWNGGKSVYLSGIGVGVSGGDPYGPKWCKNMGAPAGAAVNSNGVWTRSFANGSVRVDTMSGTATIN